MFEKIEQIKVLAYKDFVLKLSKEGSKESWEVVFDLTERLQGGSKVERICIRIWHEQMS